MSTTPAPTKPVKTSRKRSSPNFFGGHRYKLPEWAASDKENSYRWVKDTKFQERSDGIDPRGWEKVKIPEGHENAGVFLRNGDHILCSMPEEWTKERRRQLDETNQYQLKSALKSEKGFSDKLSHELKAAGGKLKLDVNVE